jgi:dTMP kinase
MDELHADKAELIARALPDGADLSRAAMVGDRRFDIEGAKRAGVHSIGVGYGYGSREELERAEPDAIAETVSDLYPILGVSRPCGKFVTFEGTDGCGKSTQQRMLADWLALRGHEVVLTREPGGCPISERVRELVLDVGAQGMTDECEALLFAAARAQHIHDVILPALESGKLVLCDRFLDSSIAYQAHGRELGETFVRQINAPAEKVKPNLTLLYALDAETAKERVLSQSAPDRIEVEKSDYFARVARAYSDIARREPTRVRVVNANGTIEEVFQKTLALAKDFLQEE